MSYGWAKDAEALARQRATEFIAYSVGVCYASVCTSLTNEEATARLNFEHPTGIAPWHLSDELFANGDPNGRPCDDTPADTATFCSCAEATTLRSDLDGHE